MIGNKYAKESIKCPECGNKMRLDDIDYNFKGSQDNYYVCDHCHEALVQKIRFGKVWKNDCFKSSDFNK